MAKAALKILWVGHKVPELGLEKARITKKNLLANTESSNCDILATTVWIRILISELWQETDRQKGQWQQNGHPGQDESWENSMISWQQNR